jgi:uncharacterized membrane protein
VNLITNGLERPKTPNVSSEDYRLIQELRERSPAQNPPRPKLTFGARLSDRVAIVMGSWYFVLIQSALLGLWLALNITAYVRHWDPYPFILLNLMLSFQAAYTAPVIMMSQNRQAAVDRMDAHHDYEVNMKAELEIELLHDKMNVLREQEMVEVLRVLRAQEERLGRMEAALLRPGEGRS